MMWTFQLFMPNCFGFRAFRILGGLVFCLFTLYSHFMVCFIFLCPYYTDPFKIPSMNVTWEFYQNVGQTKKLKRQWKVWIFFGNNPYLQNFFWLSLNSLNLSEGQTHSKWYRNIPHRRPRKFSENLVSFRTIWKHFRQSDNFPNNLESFHTIWKI